MTEMIFVISERTMFKYGKLMSEKHFYYKNIKTARNNVIAWEDKEYERRDKSKIIGNKAYVERTSGEKIFDSQNSFYIREYVLSEALLDID